VYLILLVYVTGIDDKKEKVLSETKMEIHVFKARSLSAALLTLLVSIDRLATFALQT
jgi:ABC-type molybdate transport system substrate-binding protein